MKVRIRIIKQSASSPRRELWIEGEITETIDPAGNAEIADMLFQAEYTINEYAPHLRCHIETRE
jgi:hypothetical protein